MPVIGFRIPDFESLYGAPVDRDRLLEELPMLGGDLDRVSGDEVHIEYFPDRPDLVSVEGIARAMRSFLGDERGLHHYELAAPEGTLEVDAGVGPVRPFILACHVRGLEPMDDADIKRLMDLQEKLAFGIGRRRSRVAIGIHDARDTAPPYRYHTVDGDHRFVPLAETKETTVRKLLAENPKGKAYAHLLPKDGPFPVITDKDGHLLSFPPVINGAHTALRAGTTDLLIDLTGPDLPTLRTTMAILAAAFLDRGATLTPVSCVYPDDAAFGASAGKTLVEPDMEPYRGTLSVKETERVLGLGLDRMDIIHALERLGHSATPCGKDPDEVHVLSPAWRADLLHEWDYIEDVAKGHGYRDVEGTLPKEPAFGSTHPAEKRARLVRTSLIGLGYLETTSLTITSEKALFDRFDLPRPEGDEAPVRVVNPVTEDQTVMRTWMLPSLFGILEANRHRDYPQSLFEVGQVVDPSGHNGWHVAAVRADARAGFTQVKGVAEALLRDLGVKATVAEDDHPAFVPGRVARWQVDGTTVGRCGEVHPRILERSELRVPVVALEFDLDRLLPVQTVEPVQQQA
ncbi:MAG: phenylalanine--tRNA ligase subunit beta [Euryarchaeota archaeon]|nr:phenylalanine--tRNA ligase subunit beta [Euryarchaeota archaeon]